MVFEKAVHRNSQTTRPPHLEALNERINASQHESNVQLPANKSIFVLSGKKYFPKEQSDVPIEKHMCIPLFKSSQDYKPICDPMSLLKIKLKPCFSVEGVVHALLMAAKQEPALPTFLLLRHILRKHIGESLTQACPMLFQRVPILFVQGLFKGFLSFIRPF